MNELKKFLLQLATDAEHVEGFLGKLWKIWDEDVARAVLLARWHWQELPEELVRQAEEIRQQARELAEQAQANLQQGTRTRNTASQGAEGNAKTASGMDANEATFLSTMSVIRAYEGDPPTSPEMAEMAEGVLTGRIDAVEAMLATSPPSVQQQIRTALQLGEMIGISQVLRVQGLMQAAFSLPRQRIPLLLPEAEPPRAS